MLSFALANIAFYSIINFHMYRIFGKELAKYDKTFIKKDDSFTKAANFNEVGKQYLPHFNSFAVIDNSDSKIHLTRVSTFYPLLFESTHFQISSSILPIRGSPLG